MDFNILIPTINKNQMECSQLIIPINDYRI